VVPVISAGDREHDTCDVLIAEAADSQVSHFGHAMTGIDDLVPNAEVHG
jgi:hypothetical protein